MLSLKTTHPFLLVSALTIFGCAGEVADSADADTSTTHALLVVEQAGSMGESAEVRSHASVWFLRVADEGELGAAVSLITARTELPPVGQCVMVDTKKEPVIPSKISRVELAFAGDVRLQAGSVSTPLTVRFFPNVADVVSGVTYTLQDQSDLAFPFDGWLMVSAAGSAELDPVDASTRPPAMPSELALNGEPLPAEGLEVPRGQPFSLAWTPADDSDTIYIDVDPVPAVPSERVRCALMDTGFAEIPTMALPESSEMTLTIHRMRDVALRSEHGEVGMAHFDLSVSTVARVSSH